MKNERIIDAWNKIGPDGGAAARMLGAILAYNHSVRAEKRGAHPEYRGPGRKRAIPIAVCLVAVLALTAAFGSNAGWFDRRVHTADLGNGNVLNFYKTDALGATGMDLGDVTSRELTTAENQILFGELPVTSYATFSATNKTLMRVEGNIEIKTGNAGSAKVILAAPGIPVTDTSIDADREISEVNGVPVSAGYFVTDTNSRGFSDMIYIASFAMDGVSAYLALGGAEAESEALRHVIAGMIEQLIRNGAPDLSAITE
jgi:hypothetical protein